MVIDGVYIPLKRNWNRIGISLSGGADSALLAYFVLSNTNADIYFITQVRMWKTRPWQRWVARDVVSWFREKFHNRIEHIEDARLPAETKHMGVTVCHPFSMVRKNWIIKQYVDYEIGELLEITRSCEGEFEGLDYTTYKPYQHVPYCNECFWCKEREWGIANASK